MDVLIGIGIIIFIYIVLSQIVYTEKGVSEAQDKAIKALQEGNMECSDYVCPFIGDLDGFHLLRTESGWSVFDGLGNLVVCAPVAKMSLIHRWKQKKLEKMADMYYEDHCLSFSATMRHQ